MLNRSVFMYLCAYMAPAAIGFLAVALYTHLLSPAEYGEYIIGMSVAGLVGALFFTWIRLSILRYQATSAAIDLRGTAIVTYGATTLVVAVLAPLLLLVLRPGMDARMLAAAIFMALTMSAFDIGQELRRAKLQPARFTLVAVLRSSLGFAFGFAAIKLGGGSLGLLVAVAASFLIGGLFKTGIGTGAPMQWIERDHIAQFVRYGLPLSIGGLSFALYSAGDRLVVAYLLGPEAAGLYGVSADLARQFIVILAASCASAAFPVVFRTLASEGPASARARLNENAELLLAVIAPVAVWLAVSADVFASVMLGPQFRAGVPLLLPLLVTARLFGAFNQFYLQLSFQIAERPLLQVLEDTLILVVGVVFMAVLAYEFGLVGAAIATVLTEATGLLIGWVLSRRAFAMPFPAARLVRVLAATVALAAAASGAKLMVGNSGLLALGAVFLAGALAYGGTAYALDIAHVRSSLTALLRPYLAGSRARALVRG
ncbi:MAG TPA: lipopolysaccharide biosynthesis protein [Xanthobacteraceae bacterium]|jgi:O-antigen/teichoic acid export membrane protein